MNGTTVAERCDVLQSLLWQASTHPTQLYHFEENNLVTGVRPTQRIDAHKQDARARTMAWIQPVLNAMNDAQWATQDSPAHGRKTLLLQCGRLIKRQPGSHTSIRMPTP
jgi:hypothetical protein